MGKSIYSSGNISEESSRNQGNQGGNRISRRFTPTGQQAEADLDDIDHREHEEEAAHDGADGGGEHAEAEEPEVDVGPEGVVHLPAVEQIDGQLQPLRHQRGEQEEAERHHLEHQ